MIVELALLSAAVASQSSNWRLIQRNDPVEDTAEIYAVIGDQSRHVAIGCDKGINSQPRLVFRAGQYLGSEKRGILLGGRDITFRFDDHRPIVWRAEYEDDGIIEDKKQYIEQVIDQAKSSHRLVVRALNYEGAEVDVVFTYDNPSEVIAQALSLCSTNHLSIERG